MRHKVSEDHCSLSVDGIRTRATNAGFRRNEKHRECDVLGSLAHIKPISPENTQAKPEGIRKNDSAYNDSPSAADEFDGKQVGHCSMSAGLEPL